MVKTKKGKFYSREENEKEVCKMFEKISLVKRRKMSDEIRKKISFDSRKEIDEEKKDDTPFALTPSFTPLVEDILLNHKGYKYVGRSKIDLVLDLDQTLIFSKLASDFSVEPPAGNAHNITVEVSPTKTYFFKTFLRNDIETFFSSTSKICNLFINTHSKAQYANKILELISSVTAIEIPKENVISSESNEIKLKNIEEVIKNENFLIFDDTVCSWETKYYDNIISSKKYQGPKVENDKENKGYQKKYQYYFKTDTLAVVYEYDEEERKFYDENNILYCVENDGSKSQLANISELIQKCFWLSLLMKIPISMALLILKRSILKDVVVYFSSEFSNDIEFLKEMVLSLGGNVSNNSEDSTHIIAGRAEEHKIKDEKSKKHIVSLKWLFDSFFMYKCQDESKYKSVFCSEKK